MRKPCSTCSIPCNTQVRDTCLKYWDYQDYLFEHRKWIRGQQIKTLDALASCNVIWMRGKIENRGWFQNWRLKEVENLIKAGAVYKCKPNPFYCNRRK